MQMHHVCIHCLITQVHHVCIDCLIMQMHHVGTDCLPELRGAFQAVLGPRDWGSYCATVAWEGSSQEAGGTRLCQTIALQKSQVSSFCTSVARSCTYTHTHTHTHTCLRSNCVFPSTCTHIGFVLLPQPDGHVQSKSVTG